MSPNRIRKFIEHEPFRPFRVLMKDGEEITVQKPHKALMSGSDLAMFGFSRKGAVGLHKFCLVFTNEVETVEFVKEVTERSV